MTPDERQTLATWWHPHYLAAAQLAYPDVCASHQLAVGWKLTRPDGTTTHNDYYWPLVNGDHDLPVLHEAGAWSPTNLGSCPSTDGDGLCLVTTSMREASSGGVSLSAATGHVLVYPADLARSDIDGKYRVPWCVDVDSFEPVALMRAGLVADLGGAYLGGADLARANLAGAEADAFTRFPHGFNAQAAGVTFR